MALDFTTGVLDPRVTITRALNTATRVNSSGLIEGVNANLPRFDYDPTTLAPKGLLIEETRANLLAYSDQFNVGAGWAQNNVTISANSTTSPDGTANADKIIEDTATSSHRIATGPTLAVTPYTMSVFAKASGRNWIIVGSASDGRFAYFNISNGTIGTLVGGATATITNFGNGWYRCATTFTPTTAAVRTLAIWLANADNSATYTGDGTSGAFLYGAQLEAGSFATSYIPTTTTSLTRNADVVSMTGTNFSDWYNASEGAFYVEANVPTNVDNNTGNYYLAASDGTIANQIILAEVNGTVGQIQTGGFLQFNSKVGVEPTGIVKAALAYKTNDVILCVDGTLGTLDTSVALPTVNRLSIGARGDLNTLTFLNGNIRRVSYWPQRLINAEAQAFSK
jgi:hypothetical protein